MRSMRNCSCSRNTSRRLAALASISRSTWSIESDAGTRCRRRRRHRRQRPGAAERRIGRALGRRRLTRQPCPAARDPSPAHTPLASHRATIDADTAASRSPKRCVAMVSSCSSAVRQRVELDTVEQFDPSFEKLGRHRHMESLANTSSMPLQRPSSLCKFSETRLACGVAVMERQKRRTVGSEINRGALNLIATGMSPRTFVAAVRMVSPPSPHPLSITPRR